MISRAFSLCQELEPTYTMSKNVKNIAKNNSAQQNFGRHHSLLPLLKNIDFNLFEANSVAPQNLTKSLKKCF